MRESFVLSYLNGEWRSESEDGEIYSAASRLYIVLEEAMRQHEIPVENEPLLNPKPGLRKIDVDALARKIAEKIAEEYAKTPEER